MFSYVCTILYKTRLEAKVKIFQQPPPSLRIAGSTTTIEAQDADVSWAPGGFFFSFFCYSTNTTYKLYLLPLNTDDDIYSDDNGPLFI